jgi:hypothetical protein
MGLIFVQRMKEKYPELDIDKIIGLIENNISSIKPSPFNSNKSVLFPLDCDLTNE